jgi:glycosyltransferase involved in cell wall biosynthesis
MKKIKILMLTTYPNVKGPFRKIVPLLSEALRKNGFHVVEVPWGRHHDTESVGEKVKNRFADILRIRSILLQDQFDIMFIHNGAHDLKGIVRDIPLLMATRGLYRRAVLQIHGADLSFITKEGHITRKALNHLLCSQLDGVILSSQLELEVFSQFVRTSRFFVADDIYQKKNFPDALPVPQQWNLPDGRPIIFFAARLIPEKGIQQLLTAIPLVLEQVECHFLIAGVGPLESEVRKRLSEPPLKGHASWVGYLDWDHLELAYSLTTVFTLPTYYFEGFPAVIQDALGYGLPIVTTATRGMADHLLDGVHAKMVPPQDPVALANALIDLLQNPSLRGSMSAANLKKAEDFSPEVVIPQYISILEELLDPGKSN